MIKQKLEADMVTFILETTAIQSKREAKSFVPSLQIYQPNTKQKTKEKKKQPYCKRSTRKGVAVFILNGLKWFKSITVDENIAALKHPLAWACVIRKV